MNKEIFIKKLSELSGYDIEKCTIVNDVLESHLIIGKKGQEKIINDFETKLGITEEEAKSLYNMCVTLLNKELKNKIRHPFKSRKDSK